MEGMDNDGPCSSALFFEQERRWLQVVYVYSLSNESTTGMARHLFLKHRIGISLSLDKLIAALSLR